MKAVFVMCALMVAVYARPEEKYTSKYDNINLTEIINNKRLLTSYIMCTLDQGKCTTEGKELKSHLHEALENNCAKCTPTQQDGTRLVIGHLINKEPEYWKQLSAKYDRDGKYATKYEAELKTIA